MNKKRQFLIAILGEDGTQALQKACIRNPELETAILPRALWAWLENGGPSFSGAIPGTEGTYLEFRKSESNSYNGVVKLNGELHSFHNESLVYVGACAAVALGADGERVSKRLKDTTAIKLAKSIDGLVRATVISQLKKASTGSAESAGPPAKAIAPMKPNAPTPADPRQNGKGPTVGMRPQLPKLPTGQVVPFTSADVAGATGPRANAAPTAPSGNTTPAGTPISQTAELPRTTRNKEASPLDQSKIPKVAAVKEVKAPEVKTPEPKKKTVAVTKSEAVASCSVCGQRNIVNNSFVGCMCFRALAKSVTLTTTPITYRLSFGADWDRESITTLTEVFRGGSYE